MRGSYLRVTGLLVAGLIGARLAAQVPANATAKCKDGTYSTATSTKGMCSDHGGVAEKLTKPKAAKSKPAAAAPAAGGPPAGATAKCKDGTYSTAKTTKGACSKHGGVADVLGGGAPAEAPAPKAAPPAGGEPGEAGSIERPVGAPATATAKCKDGTYSESKQHSGACSHHGGVAEWYK